MSKAGDTTFTPTVTHWGNFRIESRDGEICAVHPCASDREPSPIGENLRAAFDPAVRIAQPMVRQSYLDNPLDPAPHRRGIEAERIRDLARKLSSGRSVLGVSWSMQRQEHGEQPDWMIAVLAAMLGHIGLPGGGVADGYGCLHDSGFGGPLAASFPLHLISNQPRKKLHSQLDHGPASRSTKIRGRETARINRCDAAARGIRDGDIVRIYNERGACLAAAVISDGIRENVIELPTGAWYWAARTDEDQPLEVHGNPNVLTRDVGTYSLGQGPTAHSCLVEMERFDGVLPVNLAFDPIPSLTASSAADGQT